MLGMKGLIPCFLLLVLVSKLHASGDHLQTTRKLLQGPNTAASDASGAATGPSATGKQKPSAQDGSVEGQQEQQWTGVAAETGQLTQTYAEPPQEGAHVQNSTAGASSSSAGEVPGAQEEETAAGVPEADEQGETSDEDIRYSIRSVAGTAAAALETSVDLSSEASVAVQASEQSAVAATDHVGDGNGTASNLQQARQASAVSSASKSRDSNTDQSDAYQYEQQQEADGETQDSGSSRMYDSSYSDQQDAGDSGSKGSSSNVASQDRKAASAQVVVEDSKASTFNTPAAANKAADQQGDTQNTSAREEATVNMKSMDELVIAGHSHNMAASSEDSSAPVLVLPPTTSVDDTSQTADQDAGEGSPPDTDWQSVDELLPDHASNNSAQTTTASDAAKANANSSSVDETSLSSTAKPQDEAEQEPAAAPLGMFEAGMASAAAAEEDTDTSTSAASNEKGAAGTPATPKEATSTGHYAPYPRHQYSPRQHIVHHAAPPIPSTADATSAQEAASAPVPAADVPVTTDQSSDPEQMFAGLSSFKSPAEDSSNSSLQTPLPVSRMHVTGSFVAIVVGIILACIGMYVFHKRRRDLRHRMAEQELEVGGTWDWREHGEGNGELELLSPSRKAGRKGLFEGVDEEFQALNGSDTHHTAQNKKSAGKTPPRADRAAKLK